MAQKWEARMDFSLSAEQVKWRDRVRQFMCTEVRPSESRYAAEQAQGERSAPDTGNLEVLTRYGTWEQTQTWLKPLMQGDIRSAFLMTEPDVASSDATNIETRIEQDGDDYIITGRKWWSSGAGDPRCKLAIVMGKTDPHADKHHQQSMILVPLDAKGVAGAGRVLRQQHLDVSHWRGIRN